MPDLWPPKKYLSVLGLELTVTKGKEVTVPGRKQEVWMPWFRPRPWKPSRIMTSHRKWERKKKPQKPKLFILLMSLEWESAWQGLGFKSHHCKHKATTASMCLFALDVGSESKGGRERLYLPLSWILSASLESWSGSRRCLITPSGVTETSHREYWSGVAVTANSRMAWMTTSLAVVSLLIMMYRLCWSALKTLSTWSGKSGAGKGTRCQQSATQAK